MSESDRHNQSTAWGWISAWIVVTTVLVVLVITGVAIAAGAWTTVGLGVLLAYELAVSAHRRFHYLMHADEIETRRDEVRASNTGTWRLYVEGEAPDRFIVRWDAWGRQYVSEGETILGAPNATWVDSLTLASYLEGLERAGWVPNDDEATRAIRARLALAPMKAREDSL